MSATLARKYRLAILGGIVVAIIAIMVLRPSREVEQADAPGREMPTPAISVIERTKRIIGNGKPTLLELGSIHCIPCKMMEPVLERLRTEYAGSLNVVFIDIEKHQEAAAVLGVDTKPTQVFFDAGGTERLRHKGVFLFDEILAAWKDLGIALQPAPAALSPSVSPSNAGATGPAASANAEGAPVSDLYPCLTQGILARARAADWPERDIVLRSGDITVTAAEVQAALANAPRELRLQVEKNRFFILENLVAKRLLLRAARAAQLAPPEAPDDDVIQLYVSNLISDVSVTDAEIQGFYEGNMDRMQGRTLETVRESIGDFLKEKKRRDAFADRIRTFCDREPVTVHRGWLAEQAKTAFDNPLDRLRTSGKPSCIVFKSTGCPPCEKQAAVLDELTPRFVDRVAVFTLLADGNELLFERYGVEGTPTLMFFDAQGKLLHHQSGFMPKAACEQWFSTAAGRGTKGS